MIRAGGDRSFIGMELNDHYFDVDTERIQAERGLYDF